MTAARWLPVAAVALLAAVATACGSGDLTEREGAVTIESLPSATRAAIPVGGKSGGLVPVPTATVPAPTNTPQPAIPPGEAAEPTAAPPTATPTAVPTEGPPSSGRWIDVDVTNFVVRLMDGDQVVEEISPVAVGAEVDTGEYLSTQTGLFQVYVMVEELAYDEAFDTYISHWIGFDPGKDNGFHSFLKDEQGAVVDSSTGRVSNGCIRTGEPEAIFAFAEIGMPVWVHS